MLFVISRATTFPFSLIFAAYSVLFLTYPSGAFVSLTVYAPYFKPSSLYTPFSVSTIVPTMTPPEYTVNSAPDNNSPLSASFFVTCTVPLIEVSVAFSEKTEPFCITTAMYSTPFIVYPSGAFKILYSIFASSRIDFISFIFLAFLRFILQLREDSLFLLKCPSQMTASITFICESVRAIPFPW